ncbi:hypothetical protein Tco_1173602 [Tanacetum coccineum]
MYKRGPCGKTKRGIILSTSRSWEVREESDGLVIMDDGIVNWEEHTKLRDKSCTMAISQGSIGTSFVHSVDFESEISKVPQEVYVSKPIITNEKGVSAPKSKEVEPSCVTPYKNPGTNQRSRKHLKVNRRIGSYDGKEN